MPAVTIQLDDPQSTLRAAVAATPPGAWAVGVSGGADSVALLLLLADRPDLRLHAVHLDHETRGRQSAADAAFVKDLCARLSIHCTLATRSDLEKSIAPSRLPANRSARFRALRFELFRRARADHRLCGVVLAHHAGDQAETVFQRLLKGSSPAGLTGMRTDSTVAGVRVLRPLLAVPGDALRDWLQARNQPWREDQSNESAIYQRNRVRPLLRHHPDLSHALRQTADAMRNLMDWARDTAPALEESFDARTLAALPDVLAVEAARRWLAARGARAEELAPPVIDRLIEMARDAAAPPRRYFPGALLVRRRAGKISAGN